MVIAAIILFVITGISFSQKTNNSDNLTDKRNSLKSMDVQAPQIDLSNNFHILKQIEPSSTSSTIFNDQLLEGAVDVNKYTAGPSDIFSLGIWGIVNQPIPLAVSPEGSLIIPSVGEVNINGLTLKQAKEKVISAVKRRFISAEITLTLISPRRFTIAVTGVGQGTYPTSAVMRASTIISFIFADSISLMKSGTAPSDRGAFSLRNITVKHKNGSSQRVDLYKYFATQDERYNPYLTEGDVINIPKYDWEAKFIAIQGAVQYPGTFEYIEGDDLETAMQLVRGVTSMANTDSILISRLEPGAARMTNFYVSYEDNKKMKLEANDRLVIQAFSEQRRGFNVAILGEVMKPGRYFVSLNTTRISDIIREAGGLTQNAYLPISEVYRRVDTFFIQRNRDSLENIYSQRLNDVISNKDERESFEQDNRYKIGRVNIDFEKLANGDESQDIALHDGDIIYIGDNKKQVYVYGQVNRPGFVPYKEGADYEYYVNAAGGFADRADEDELRVIKFKTREWLEPDETKIQSNDFVYVPKIIRRDFTYDIDLIAKIAAVVGSIVTLALLIIQAQK